MADRLAFCRNFWVLWGTCSTWFLLDIAYCTPLVTCSLPSAADHPAYPLTLSCLCKRADSQNLFLPNVLEAIGYNPKIVLPVSKLPCWTTHSCPHMPYPVNADISSPHSLANTASMRNYSQALSCADSLILALGQD